MAKKCCQHSLQPLARNVPTGAACTVIQKKAMKKMTWRRANMNNDSQDIPPGLAFSDQQGKDKNWELDDSIFISHFLEGSRH